MENALSSILEQFPQLKILVIGEAILDTLVRGRADRLALEGPVPVIHARESLEMPGGAANVALNARRLGAQVELLSVIGQDADGDALLAALQDAQVDIQHIIRTANRQTLLKRRIYADSTLVTRYDQGSSDPIDAELEERLMRLISQSCSRVDVIILADYGQGLFTASMLNRLARLQEHQPCVLVADTRRLEAYRGLRLAAIRPSHYSALEIIDARENGDGSTDSGNEKPAAHGGVSATQHSLYDQISEAGEKILQMLDTQMVAITLDDNGALVLDRDSSVYRTYASAQPFNRVSGAGDAFVAGLALALAAGAQAAAAAEIASAVAEIVVEKDGLPACCLDEVKSYLSGDQKLVDDWAALDARLETLRQQGKRIVFTNGVFDILHSAHVAYLNQAKSYGDVLVIGVNTDESVKRLKGPTRPINSLIERCRVLAGLSCVDFVAPFGQNNPIELIHYVRPKVYVKGGDYTRETLPESEVVESYGGELRLVPYIENHSTSGVIERIRNLYIDSPQGK